MNDSKNYIRDQIFTCIEISKRSKVPMLFMSNPGYGKTTSINLFAKTHGYHVETLIGSHYSQDEILGFQANTGAKHLTILEPEWFTRIMYAKSKNIPAILFLDELSTVSPSVQGALLQLCFERKIRGGKSLPDDCIVIAAANYKQNLPGFSDIIAPELNRFCIINLLPPATWSIYDNSIAIIEEFTQDFKEVTTNLPVFRTNYSFSDEKNKEFLEKARNKLKSIFKNHSREKSTSSCVINFRNTLYDGIYDRMDGIPEVFNFISPRSISYYLRIVKTLCEMGIEPRSIIVNRIVDGLLGLGTNTFTSDDDAALKAQIKFFQNELYDMTNDLIKEFSGISYSQSTNVMDKQKQLIPADRSITGKITNFISSHENKRITFDSDFSTLMRSISSAFDVSSFNDSIKRLYKNPEQFRSDYETIKIFRELLNEKVENRSNYDFQICFKNLDSIIKKFESSYLKLFAA